jgi:serine/threonine-protein kinase
MNAPRYQQVKQIFLAACELPSGEIEEFLRQACGDDALLRKEVESLLRHHFETTLLADSLGAGGEEKLKPVVPPVPLHEIRAGGGQPSPERFPPGRTLAGRYRMLTLLGRGGMGQVYRADDLKLDQAVALKFLPPRRTQDAQWLAWYRREVRLARRVAHPNVTRVYDIVETDGEVFISMEYVDGEDLSSLLRRIGRVSGEKSLEIARQLCLGLGAVHAEGVLHRDLKPANVMIDGRGKVRITDFGIASLAVHGGGEHPMAGTPAYLAPEIFQGGKPSLRSDLYSLGLVLYELVTGREPFEGESFAQRAADTPVLRPSTIVPEVDAGLERMILQCLERDPKRRPDSAYAVAAALPGGDPLALALAAGETPSPSMVAAAGPPGIMHPWVAVGCLAAALAALFLVVCLADRTFFLPRAGLAKPPAVLADKAESMICALGSPPRSRERWQGFAISRGYLKYAVASEDRRRAWASLAAGRPPAVCFWYRTGGDPIALPALLGEPLPGRVFPTEPGAVTVRLDGRARLLQYVVTLDRSGFSDAATQPPDWSVPCEMAGLRMGELHSVRPVRQPPLYADAVLAWEGKFPEYPQSPVRVEGASLGGRIVFFEVVPPRDRDQDWGDAEERPSRLPRIASGARLLLNLLAIIGGSFLAWHNVRLGRGDQRGAGKLVVLVLFCGLLDWLLGERHVGVFTEEVGLFYVWMARAALTAAIAWISYFAMEPYVRRFWPQTMITWSRLLDGRFRDPAVGRDVLVGGMIGILLVLIVQLDVLLPSWFGAPPPVPMLPAAVQDLAALLGLRYKLSILVTTLMTGMSLSLVVLLLMLIMRVVVRPPWLATTLSWLLLTACYAVSAGCDVSFPWLVGSLIVAITMVLLVRVGLVALIASSFFWFLIVNSPMTANFHAWYWPASSLAVALASALLIYGFLTARAGQWMFWGRLLDR